MANTKIEDPQSLPCHPGLAVEPVRNGLGIVARKSFRPGQEVCEVFGKITTAKTLWHYWETTPQRAENCFRYDAGRYLDPQGHIGQYANHSCNPNCRIQKHRGKLLLMAVKPIARNEEVTHDYSTLLGADDVWRMRCNCGEIWCRKSVRNVAALPVSTLVSYVRQQMIPRYILATLSRNARLHLQG